MKVVISNIGEPGINSTMDYESYWARYKKNEPERGHKVPLFEYRHNWGFHMFALGVYLMDIGVADEVEFWNYSEKKSIFYYPLGFLWVQFHNEYDVKAYIDRFGYPDLYVNHGRNGLPIVQFMEGKCFRVHVATLRTGLARLDNHGADCYLVDADEYLDDRSILYIPVVNIKKIYPVNNKKKRDFIYLASNYSGKRHNIVVDAVRGTDMTGHFHPVNGGGLDLTNTHITTTNWDEEDVVKLLRTSRIAVYPGDNTSNPAAMWECVAAGLPIVVNENIKGGKRLVIPGATGEFAKEDNFYDVMRYVLKNRESYTPREYFMEHWDTIPMLERYINFFKKMGWRY